MADGTDDMTTDETREEFEARYPRPKSLPEHGMSRVLVRCRCDYAEHEHWAWGYWYHDEPGGDLPAHETLAEEEPTL